MCGCCMNNFFHEFQYYAPKVINKALQWLNKLGDSAIQHSLVMQNKSKNNIKINLISWCFEYLLNKKEASPCHK